MKITLPKLPIAFRRPSVQFFIATAGSLVVLPVLFAADSASIPPGTEVSVRTIDGIESRKAEAGQVYRCSLDEPIVVADKEISGRGADCVLRVVETVQAGKLSGSSELKLEVSQIRVGSELIDVASDPSQLESKNKGKSAGVRAGIGAIAGAGLGRVLGGSKGARIGAGAGAGAGAATAALTKGPEIKVAPETVLRFIIR